MSEPFTILYAEDERCIRQQFKSLLVKHGYVVREFRNGAEAVADFSRQRSDVVVLDVMMPRMSGRDACIAIRELDPEVPIIFHTAFDTETDELSGLAVGADDFVSKSSSNEIFLSRVAAAARRVRRSPSVSFPFGAGRVNAEACVFTEGNHRSRLSQHEVALLRIMCENPNRVLSKDFLQTRLFGPDYPGDLRSFDKTLERLRAKLADSASFLHTVPRQGVEYTPPEWQTTGIGTTSS